MWPKRNFKTSFFFNHLPIYCFFSVDLPFECTPNCLIRARINLHLSRCGYTFLLNECIDHLSFNMGTAPKHLAVFFTYSQKRITAFHWITAAICRSPHPPMLHSHFHLLIYSWPIDWLLEIHLSFRLSNTHRHFTFQNETATLEFIIVSKFFTLHCATPLCA